MQLLVCFSLFVIWLSVHHLWLPASCLTCTWSPGSSHASASELLWLLAPPSWFLSFLHLVSFSGAYRVDEMFYGVRRWAAAQVRKAKKKDSGDKNRKLPLIPSSAIKSHRVSPLKLWLTPAEEASHITPGGEHLSSAAGFPRDESPQRPQTPESATRLTVMAGQTTAERRCFLSKRAKMSLDEKI